MVDLERDLIDLGDHLATPAGTHLSSYVTRAIAEMPRRRQRRRLVAVLAAITIGAGAAVAAPVVADWLGVGGVEVRREPPPVRPRLGFPLDLGRQVSFGAAERAAGFNLVVPTRLGAPDEVWLDSSSGNGLVSFLYRHRADLRAASATGVGALFTQVEAGIAEEPFATKFAEPNTRIEAVDLGTGRALWIEGVHSVAFRDQRGNIVIERLRLADSVLLWERGRVTLRLETALGRDEAIRIARSAR